MLTDLLNIGGTWTINQAGLAYAQGGRMAQHDLARNLEAWRSLATGVLRKGGYEAPEDLDRSLGTTTYDGVRVAPLYTANDYPFPREDPGVAPFTRGGTARPARWEIRQSHAEPDPGRCLEAIRQDLAGGVDSLWLHVGDDAIPGATLPALLAGLDLRRVGLLLDAGTYGDVAAGALLTAAEQASVPPNALTGNLGLDPLAAGLRTGKTIGLSPVAVYARRCVTTMPGVRAVAVDGALYQDAGGSDAEELGCAIAAGVAYLRAMVTAGLDVADALGQLEFRYAASADQFLTIAKLRAARQMWGRVAQVCGAGEHGAQRQHVVTSAAMMTARDPWTNLVRTTVAAFSAAVAGAHAITVQPFDVRLGRPDDHARRIARNTHAVLYAEAHLDRVADPAGGSWYVEWLTDELARHAWDWFTEIEAVGGMASAIECGRVTERLAGTWSRRAGNAATRRDPITGVSAIPNPQERLPERTAAPDLAGPLVRRPAALFESLRDRTDAHTRRTGTRPAVTLVTLGPPARHAPGVAFATELFAVAGLATEVRSAEYPTAAPVAVACLCGDDPGDVDAAAAVAKELRNCGTASVWQTGAGSADAGVGGRIYEGCDVLEVLRKTLDDLEVAR